MADDRYLVRDFLSLPLTRQRVLAYVVGLIQLDEEFTNEYQFRLAVFQRAKIEGKLDRLRERVSILKREEQTPC